MVSQVQGTTERARRAVVSGGLSLRKVYSVAEVRSWLGSMPESEAFLVELKADGVCVTCVYEDGVLVRALTRGGVDVTGHVLGLVPRFILRGGVVEVRGEVVVPLSWGNCFESGGHLRHVVASALQRVDGSGCVGFEFWAHGVGLGFGGELSQLEVYRCLRDWGFSVIPVLAVGDCESVCSVFSKSPCESVLSKVSPGFRFDGLVFKLNSRASQDLLGETSRFPRWALALKGAGVSGV